MSTIEIPIKNPQYLSPGLAIGEDPSGQLIGIVRFVGIPTEKMLSLLNRAVNLCDLEYLEDPFYLKGRWCCKLKTKDEEDG